GAQDLRAARHDRAAKGLEQSAGVDLSVVGHEDPEARPGMARNLLEKLAAETAPYLPGVHLPQDGGAIVVVGEMEDAAPLVADVDAGAIEQVARQLAVQRTGTQAELEERSRAVRFGLRAEDPGRRPARLASGIGAPTSPCISGPASARWFPPASPSRCPTDTRDRCVLAAVSRSGSG